MTGWLIAAALAVQIAAAFVISRLAAERPREGWWWLWGAMWLMVLLRGTLAYYQFTGVRYNVLLLDLLLVSISGLALAGAAQTLYNARAQQSLLETLLKSSHDGVFVLDPTGRVVISNHSAETLLQGSLTHGEGDRTESPAAARVRVLAAEVFQTGVADCAEITLPHDEGRTTLALVVSPVRDSQGRPTGVIGTIRDVSRSVQEREELRESEARLQLALRAGRLFAWTWHMETDRLTHDSEPDHGLIPGVASSPAALDRLLQAVHPEDRARIGAAIRACQTTGCPYEETYRLYAGDGRLRWLEAAGLVVRGPTGKPERLTGVTRDVTDERTWREALEQSEARFRTWCEAAPIGVFVSEPGRGCVYVNPWIAKAWGCDAEELLGNGYARLIHPDDREEAGRACAQAMHEGRVLRCEYRVVASGGTRRMRVDSAPLHGGDGEGRGCMYVGCIQDVTAEAELEQQLRSNEARLRSILDHSPAVICITDRNHRFVEINAAGLRILGRSREDVVGRRMDDVLLPRVTQVNLEMAEQVLETGRPSTQVWTFEHGQESRRFLSSKFPLRDLQGEIEGFGMVSLDIEEQLRAEALALGQQTRWKLAAELIGLGLWEWNLETGEIYIDPEYKRQIGYEDHELPNTFETFESRIHPDDRSATVERAVRYRRERGDLYDVEFRYQHRDGHYLWVNSRGALVPGTSVMVGFHWDITARKELEERLATSEARLRQVVENMPILMDAFDSQWRVVAWNRECERVTGYSAEEMRREPDPMSVLYPDPVQRAAILARWRGKRMVNAEETLIAKDGTPRVVRWFNISGEYPISGWASWAVGVDVTAQRAAERLLTEREAQLRMALEAGGMGTWNWDLRTGEVVWSAEHARLLGLELTEFDRTYAAFAERVLPEDLPALERAVAMAKQSGERYECEHRVRWRDGTFRWMRGLGRFEYDDCGNPVCMNGVIMDITQRKMAERELAQQHERLQTILDRIPLMICLLDRNGQASFSNPHWDGLLGWSLSEIVGNPSVMEQIFPDPDELARVRQHYADANGTWADFCPITRDGRTVFCSFVAIRLSDATLCIGQDITHRKQAEAAIQQQHHETATLLWITELVRRSTSMSEAFQEIAAEIRRVTGFPSVSLEIYDAARQRMVFRGTVGVPFSVTQEKEFQVSVEQSLSGVVAQTGQLLIERDAQSRIEYAHPTLRRVNAKVYIGVPMLIGSEVYGVVSLAHTEAVDVSENTITWLRTLANAVAAHAEQRRAAEALRESELRFRLLSEHAHDIIALHSWDGRLTYVNPAVEAVLGYAPESLLGLLPYSYIHPADVFLAYEIHARIVTGNALPQDRFLFRARRHDGGYVWLETSLSAIHNETGVNSLSVLSVSRNVTERIASEARRRQMEIQIVRSQKLESLALLAGGVAHDFNNLLLAMLGHLTLARESVVEGEAIEHLEQVEVGIRRASELTNQMLAYSGRGKFAVELVDLSQLVREMTALLRSTSIRQASILDDLAHGLPRLQADATQLRQVVMNLVTNACDAIRTPPGEVRVRTTLTQLTAPLEHVISETALTPGWYVVLEVSDNGSGMTPETVAAIWEPYFTTKFTGRGLGLSAVLGIVRGHSGGITVRSAPGAGTTFQVYFPVPEASPDHPVLAGGSRSGSTTDAEPAGTPSAEVESTAEAAAETAKLDLTCSASAAPPSGAPDPTAPPRPAATPQHTVLVIDDEPIILNVTRAVLAGAGWNVYTACSARDGLRLLATAQPPPQVLLLDVTMPEIDGLETLRLLRESHPCLPVVLSSGYSADEAILGLMVDEFCRFLKKPYHPRDLIAALAECVGRTA